MANEFDNWRGRVEERVNSINMDVKGLKEDFGNHLKEHAKSLKDITQKWFFLNLALIAGIFSLVVFILNTK